MSSWVDGQRTAALVEDLRWLGLVEDLWLEDGRAAVAGKTTAANSGGTPGKDKATWELTPHEVQAATTLGFYAVSWDSGMVQLNAAANRPWSALPPQLRAAAAVLGYTSREWNEDGGFEELPAAPPAAASPLQDIHDIEAEAAQLQVETPAPIGLGGPLVGLGVELASVLPIGAELVAPGMPRKRKPTKAKPPPPTSPPGAMDLITLLPRDLLDIVFQPQDQHGAWRALACRATNKSWRRIWNAQLDRMWRQRSPPLVAPLWSGLPDHRPMGALVRHTFDLLMDIDLRIMGTLTMADFEGGCCGVPQNPFELAAISECKHRWILRGNRERYGYGKRGDEGYWSNAHLCLDCRLQGCGMREGQLGRIREALAPLLKRHRDLVDGSGATHYINHTGVLCRMPCKDCGNITEGPTERDATRRYSNYVICGDYTYVICGKCLEDYPNAW